MSPVLSSFQFVSPVQLQDSTVTIRQSAFATQQGLTLNFVRALSAPADETILNFSDIALTAPYPTEAILHVSQKQPINLSFSTFLAFSSGFPFNSGGVVYAYINPSLFSSSSISLVPTIGALNTTFFFQDIDGVNCKISTIDNGFTKCLTVNIGTATCNFQTESASSISDIFQYGLDGNGYLKLFFLPLSAIIQNVNGTLSAVALTNVPFTSASIIKTAYQKLTEPNFPDNFVYYNKLNSRKFTINSVLSGVPNNTAIYFNYESTNNFVQSNSAAVEYFPLKNALSNNFWVNDQLPLTNLVSQRQYTSILSKNNSERYAGDLQFNYNYYTAEFVFIPDKTTQFTLPTNLYPYATLNINDSNLINIGAYGGLSPVFADKIYKNLDINENINKYNEGNGTILYTWLFTDTAELTSYWLDRYYYPSTNSLNVAFSGTANQVFQWTPALSTFITTNFSVASGFNYYDIKSTLMFEPSATYYYSRIGNNYVEKVLSMIPVAVSAMNIYNTQGLQIDQSDNITLANNYGNFVLTPNNDDNSFSISFDLNSNDKHAIDAPVIIGNNFDQGISLYKGGLRNIFTPGILINTSSDIAYVNEFETFKFNLSSYVGAPIIVIDIINTGFDHTIKALYYNTVTNYPGLIEFSVLDTVHNKVEFTQNHGLFQTGVTSKLYIDAANILYFVKNGSGLIVMYQINYALNTLINLGTITGAFNSFTLIAGIIIGLKGFAGKTLGNYGVSKIKNSIYFKNLITSTEAVTLTAATICDFEVLNNAILFVSTPNKISSFTSAKVPLASYSYTNTITSFKLDFINRAYQTDLLNLYTADGSNYSIDIFSTGLTLLSTISTNIPCNIIFQEDNLGGNQFLLQAPTNFSNINNVNGFNTADLILRADFATADNYKNRSTQFAYLTANNNSHIIISVNISSGFVNTYLDGILTSSLNLSGYNFYTSGFLKNNFGIGSPYNGNIATVGPDYAQNFSVDNLTVYNTSLTDDEAKLDFLKNRKINAINFDIPTGTRNNTDTIESTNRFTIPGRKANNIKVYVKNLGLDENDQNTLEAILQKAMLNIVPLNTNNILFDWSINNE